MVSAAEWGVLEAEGESPGQGEGEVELCEGVSFVGGAGV